MLQKVFCPQVDLGSCPSEVVERAVVSKELSRVLDRHTPDELVLKVVGREEYLLVPKPISAYKVFIFIVCVSV